MQRNLTETSALKLLFTQVAGRYRETLPRGTLFSPSVITNMVASHRNQMKSGLLKKGEFTGSRIKLQQVQVRS
jgi:hypothetical protein